MADLTTAIQIILSGGDTVSAGLRAVGGAMGDLSERGKSLTQPFADATSGILKFETGVISVGAAVTGFAIGAADKFDASFREIATLTDQSVEGLGGYSEAILDYASDSTRSLEDIEGALYNAVSAGVDYNDSLKLLNTTEKLSVAGKAELNQTTLAVVSTLNAYGESIDQAGKYSDVLFQTVKKGQTTLPELASGLSGVTSTAVLAGVPIEQLGAAIATLTAAGAPTSEALTRINALLSAIIMPSGEAADLAKELGLQWDIQALKSKGLSGVLEDMAAKTKGAGDKMAILTGGTEALNAANVLAISSAGKFKDNLTAMEHAAGAVDTAFGKMKDATDTLGQAVTVALIRLGAPLLDEFNAIEDALAELAKSVGTAVKSEAFAPLIAVIETNLGKIAALIGDTAKNLPAALNGVDFNPFAQALQALFDAIAKLFNFDALSTEKGLTTAIQTVVNLLTQTTTYSTGALQSIGPFVNKLGEFAVAISTIDLDKIEAIGQIGGYALAANAALGLLGTSALAISGAANVTSALGAGLAAVKTEAAALSLVLVGGGTGGLLAALGTAGIAGAVGVLSYEVAKSTGLGEWLNDVLAPDWLTGDGSTLGTAIADVAEKMGLLGGAAEQAQPKLAALPPYFDAEAKAAAATRSDINGWLDAQEVAAKKAADTGPEIAKLTEHFRALGYAYNAVTGELTKLSVAQAKNNDTLPDGVKVSLAYQSAGAQAGIYATAVEGIATQYEQVGVKTVKATGAFKAVGDSASDQAKKVDEATKKSQEYQLKMEEIASNERIKIIEAKVTLNVAELEAQTKQVEAAFDSISTTINSTGDLLGSLFGNLAGADTFTKLEIIEQIEAENKRRDAALELQRKLTEAEIENVQAKTRALDRGDSLLKIDGTGLAPELEAFMWAVIKAIEVRANASFAEYLLGLPA